MISTNRSAYVAYQMIAGQDDCNFVTKTNIVDMLKEEKITRICAPMVRYSRLPFRLLVRKYKSDLAYTPMIVANSFVQSQKCFDANLTTNDLDTPLIAQFAANNATDFAAAAEISYPLVDGVDLNCGCPQRWAMLDGYGAQLIETPEKIVDFVKFTRSRISDSKFSISTKIRIHDDIRKTVNLCQSLEKIGVSFIAIHGRTAKERKQPVHYDVIKLVKDSISIPVIANGDVVSLETMQEVHRLTGAFFCFISYKTLIFMVCFLKPNYLLLSNYIQGMVWNRMEDDFFTFHTGNVLPFRTKISFDILHTILPYQRFFRLEAMQVMYWVVA